MLLPANTALSDLRVGLWPLLIIVAGLVLGQPGVCFAASMNGPPQPSSRREVSMAGSSSQPLLGAIRFFQGYISPTDGARCQFSPTCSAFGHQAIHRHGAWLGVLMTADRLMRCSPLTDPAEYPRLADGRLADPVVASQGGQ